MRVTRPIRVAVLVIASLAAMFGVPVLAGPPAGALPPDEVPTQFIGRQFTELLGRAPTPQEWTFWTGWFEGQTSCASAVTQMTADLIGTTPVSGSPSVAGEFDASNPATGTLSLADAVDYDLDGITVSDNGTPGNPADDVADPDDVATYGKVLRGARGVAYVRAVFGHDPNASDWGFIRQYVSGSQTWSQFTSTITFWAVVLDADEAVCTPSPSYPFANANLDPLEQLDLTDSLRSRTHDELRAAIDAAKAAHDADPLHARRTVLLMPGEVVRVGTGSPNNNLDVPWGVTLRTAGSPAPASYARMGRLVPSGTELCEGDRCQGIGIVRVQAFGYVTNVWADGSGTTDGSSQQANIQIESSGAWVPAKVESNRVSDPAPGGTGVRTQGFGVRGTDCANAKVIGNLVTGYGSSHGIDGIGRSRAVNGIEAGCEQTYVTGNQLVDVTGIGVLVAGNADRDGDVRSQRSLVQTNTVISAGLDAVAAVGLDAVGRCLDPDETHPIDCLDIATERTFGDVKVQGNVLWTGARTHLDVALMLGGAPIWGNHRYVGVASGGVTRSVTVSGNTTGVTGGTNIGARVGMGITVHDLHDADIAASTSQMQFQTLTSSELGHHQTWGACPTGTAVVISSDDDPDTTVSLGGLGRTTSNAARGCIVAPSPPGALEQLARGAGAQSGDFFTASGIRFKAWGFNWAAASGERPDLGGEWWDHCDATQACWDEVVEDFRDMRRMGTNMVRLLVPFRDIIEEDPANPGTGRPDPHGVQLLHDLITVAGETGIYVDISGLMEEVSPDADPVAAGYQEDWFGALTTDADRWAAQQVFWETVARLVAGDATVTPTVAAHPYREAVAWYSLMNEPIPVRVPELVMTPNPASSGAPIVLSGYGCRANTSVTATLDGEPLVPAGAAMSNPDGSFAVTFTLPASSTTGTVPLISSCAGAGYFVNDLALNVTVSATGGGYDVLWTRTHSRWCANTFAGRCFNQRLTLDHTADTRTVYDAWVQQQADAIDAIDPATLVTLGTAAQWGPVHPRDMGSAPASFDFLSPHVYACWHVFPTVDCEADDNANGIPDGVDADLFHPNFGVLTGLTLPPDRPIVIEESGPIAASEEVAAAFVVAAGDNIDGVISHYWRTADGRSTPSEFAGTTDPQELSVMKFYRVVLRGGVR